MGRIFAMRSALVLALSLVAASVGATTVNEANRYYNLLHPSTARSSTADYDWMPRGIVLWSLGRSGTSAFWETMHTWCMDSDLKINTICHMKEGFRTEPVSEDRVESCMSEIPPQRAFFTHLKPGHLKSDSDIPSPYEFLKRIKTHGGKVLLVIRRQNWLARAVSSAELQMDKNEATRVIGSEARHQAMRQFFARSSYDETAADWAERLDRQSGAIIDQGEVAGRQLGYRVLNFNYNKDDWPCSVVKKAVEAVVEEGILPHMPLDTCVDSHKMEDVSHRELSLVERVGPYAAANIDESMKGTKFEWMLDLGRESPPEDKTLSYSVAGYHAVQHNMYK